MRCAGVHHLLIEAQTVHLTIGACSMTKTDIEQLFAEATTAVAGLSTGLDRIAIEIQDLKDQLARGGVITQNDLDALGETARTFKQAAVDALAKEESL